MTDRKYDLAAVVEAHRAERQALRRLLDGVVAEGLGRYRLLGAERVAVERVLRRLGGQS